VLPGWGAENGHASGTRASGHQASRTEQRLRSSDREHGSSQCAVGLLGGFKETEVAPNQYRIEVVGNANTPRERLEKIAATRAAEIGTENRLGYFRIDGVELATRCEQYTVGGQRGGSGTEKRRQQHTVLTANVTYTKQPADPSYVEAKTAFPQYRAELDQDLSAPLPADPALSAQCS
jgi:hypothetical protein